MKKPLLTERFQQLAGIKPLYEDKHIPLRYFREQATPYPFESVNDLMRYFADNNISLIENSQMFLESHPYLIKSINSTLEEEEENYPDAEFLSPKRIREVVEQIINAEVRR